MSISMGTGSLVEALSGRQWNPAQVRQEVLLRMARYGRNGLQAGDRAIIGFGNNLEFFADLLAIWQLGACAIPIDSRLTPFEVASLVSAAEPRLFLFHEEIDPILAERLSAFDLLVLDSCETGELDSPPIAASFGLDDDALILFTSGTTGDPKGVVHSHRSLRARWATLRQSLGIEAYERTLCLLPTHFGHGLICNCLFPWLLGQDLFILPPFKPEVLMRLGSILDQHQITFMSSVPSVWRLCLKTAKPPALRTLQRVFCGSAPLSAHLWRQIQEWTGTSAVWNSYGITETGSWVAGTSLDQFEPENGLIGVPWGAEIRIMKSGGINDLPNYGEECAVGETGYIWLNTPALMCGYFRREDLTSQVVSQGWFMTGDLGIIDERGCLYLRSRIREEINKGGAKIYPADIDAVVERFPAVRDMCCFPVEDKFYGQNIGLALVLDDQSDASLRRLHDWLKEHLAEHQMPVKWYLLDDIPRTSRGKINRDKVAESCASFDAVDLRGLLR